MDEYLLCSALNRDISPPSSLPTALICLPMAWQISLPAAICAFSPRRPPSVARSMKDTQRREYTASTCVCVAFGWDTRSSTWDRNVAKLRSSHWPPSVVTNTTYAWVRWRGRGCDEMKDTEKTESCSEWRGVSPAWRPPALLGWQSLLPSASPLHSLGSRIHRAGSPWTSTPTPHPKWPALHSDAWLGRKTHG